MSLPLTCLLLMQVLLTYCSTKLLAAMRSELMHGAGGSRCTLSRAASSQLSGSHARVSSEHAPALLPRRPGLRPRLGGGTNRPARVAPTGGGGGVSFGRCAMASLVQVRTNLTAHGQHALHLQLGPHTHPGRQSTTTGRHAWPRPGPARRRRHRRAAGPAAFPQDLAPSFSAAHFDPPPHMAVEAGVRRVPAALRHIARARVLLSLPACWGPERARGRQVDAGRRRAATRAERRALQPAK